MNVPRPNPSAPETPHEAASRSLISSPSLSDLDRSLLSSLFDPASSLLSTAAACGLDLLDLAHWLAQPRVQAQVERIESLRGLRHEIWAEQLRREAAEALREAMKAAEDPAERRRCANTVLRASSRPRPQRMPLVPARRDPPPAPEDEPAATGPRARASVSEPNGSTANSPPSSELRDSIPPPTSPLAYSTPITTHSTPVSPSHLSDTLSNALATLRALGYDTTEAELTDDELDALEDEELDAELDAELDEYAADLTDAEMAEALTLARQYVARPHDTS